MTELQYIIDRFLSSTSNLSILNTTRILFILSSIYYDHDIIYEIVQQQQKEIYIINF